MLTINIYRDNDLKKTFTDQATDFCAFKYLLNAQPQSTDYALMHGGWKVEVIDNDTGNVECWEPYTKLRQD